ncbi:hypothetical protein LINPERHAP1_LOCUS28685 [Linum perenne]
MVMSFLILGVRQLGDSFVIRLADVLELLRSIWVGALLLGRSFGGFLWDLMLLGRLVSRRWLLRGIRKQLFRLSQVLMNLTINTRAKSWQSASVSNVTGKSLYHIFIERGTTRQITWKISGMVFLRVPIRSMCRIVFLVISFVLNVWVSPNPELFQLIEGALRPFFTKKKIIN